MAGKAWILLAYGDDRQNASGQGYEDSRERYSFDSLVPNHKQVREGDLLLIAGRDGKHGRPLLEAVAMAASVRLSPGRKRLGRCPEPGCDAPRYKRRETKDPPYRCDRGHNFREPAYREVDVVQYTVEFGGSWGPVRGISVADLRGLQLRVGDANAIRAADREAALRLLSDAAPAALPVVEEGRRYADPDQVTDPWPRLSTT